MSGGFGSYLLGMDQATHDRVNTAETGDIPGNEGVKNPGLGWMIGFTFIVSFVGIFSIVLLRKVWPNLFCVSFSFKNLIYRESCKAFEIVFMVADMVIWCRL
jgi:hypothetical protein